MNIQDTPESPFHALELWEPDSRPVTLRRDDHEPFWGDDGFTFDDILDMVNPLQHLPVASQQYREATGDTASEGARLVGGAVFGVLTGGIFGLVASLVNAAVRHDTGQDLADHALALLKEASPTASVAASMENKKSISRIDSSADRRRAEPTDFFVDDVAARSLHPAERLLAIGSHYPIDPADAPAATSRQEPQQGPERSLERKASAAYRDADAREPGRFWWEV